MAQDDWRVSREFKIKHAGEYYLDATYLNTVTTILLNGAVVIEAQNCFRRYRPDVSPALRVGMNTIEIVFHYNIRVAAGKQAAQPFYILYAKQNGEEHIRIVDFEDANPARYMQTFIFRELKLWWPTGLGDQHLYELHIECEEHIVKRKIGLRHIQLDTQQDEVGARFAFRINGKEIFCLGANWIPANAFPSQATPKLRRSLLQSALDANMSMDNSRRQHSL